MVEQTEEVRPMGGDRLYFTTATMKWGLFAVFFLVAPAPVIVFNSFMTGPVIFVAASLISLIAEAFTPGAAPNVEIIGYFAIHLLLFVLLYYLAALGTAKGLALIANRRVRHCAFAALVLGGALVAFCPVYGGAGIHSGAWGPITFFFAKLNESHFGPNAALYIYGPFLLSLAAVCAYLWHRRAGWGLHRR
jgi:hypothetical protein